MSPVQDPTAPARSVAINRRGRTLMALAAVLLPMALGGLFYRQDRRLRALADHGVQGTATLVSRQSGTAFYTYPVNGTVYDWNVHVDDAPYPVGSTFAITYLPEDPSLSRPVWPYTPAAYASQRNPVVLLGCPGVLWAVCALGAWASHRAVRRAQAGLPPLPPRHVSPLVAGRALAGVFTATALAADLDPKVRAVFRTLWGAHLPGASLMVVVVTLQLILGAPVWPMAVGTMEIVLDHMARGGSISRAGIVMAVWDARDTHRRARTTVLAGGVYFVLLFALWIAYAAYRGV